MDLSIDQLFASLQTTQKSKSTIRLSERNVVELIIKLKQVREKGLGFFSDLDPHASVHHIKHSPKYAVHTM